MTKAELGAKRLCPNCGTRYYDLNRDPIVCPKCGTRFEVTALRARAQAKAAVVVKEEEVEVEEAAPAEFVSLEEADEEAADSGKVEAEVDVEVEGDDEVEADDEADDTFLAEEEEEGDDDVADIIGDVDEEER